MACTYFQLPRSTSRSTYSFPHETLQRDEIITATRLQHRNKIAWRAALEQTLYDCMRVGLKSEEYKHAQTYLYAHTSHARPINACVLALYTTHTNVR